MINVSSTSGRTYLDLDDDVYSFSDDEARRFFYLGFDIRHRMDKGASFEEAVTAFALARVQSDEDALEKAYRDRELQYRTQDVLNIADELGFDVDEEDAEWIAAEFIEYGEDTTRPEYDQMADLIAERA